MRRKPRIALAQIKYFDLHPSNNLAKIKEYITKAKKRNADIVCFPETCVIYEKYLHFDHKYLNEIRAECKKHKIWAIITEDFKVKSKLYNTSVLIDRDGKVKGTYYKINIYAERGTSPGKDIRVFNTDFGKVGLSICWDLAFPELFHAMKKKGAEIVFCPSQWAYEKKAYYKGHKKKELKLLKALIRARSFENLNFVAFCSPYLSEKDMVCYSAVACPHKIIKEIYNKEGLIVAELDMKEVKKLKKIYPGK
ncbi:MAG: carbon-nitrogen hydrolase family protein [Candidatus Nanoarchaeia archaeon]|nr:carbon-nitrogen hydrolase family protein [Candidatus Nanoarchaeia archaeon]